MEALIKSNDDLLRLMDKLFSDHDRRWWTEFYRNRGEGIPFFIDKPDECLVAYLDAYVHSLGNALDLGCGNGRNAICLARRGFTVDAVDFSETAIEWAGELAEERQCHVNFIRASIFDVDFRGGYYDLIYDSGCLHHLPPHRRPSYIRLVADALKVDGYLGLTCFGKEFGSGYSDEEAFRKWSLDGGLGFAEEEVASFFSRDFELVESRRMRNADDSEAVYGKSFMITALFRRRAHTQAGSPRE